MIGFGRKRTDDELERRLRDERPEPPAELLSTLEARVTPLQPEPRSSRRLGYGLAAGFAASFAVLFAAVGGFGVLSGSSQPAAVTVAVPAKAVPALKVLQKQGAVIADASVLRSTGRVASGASLRSLKLERLSPAVEAAKGQAESKSGSGSQARTLVPFVAKNVDVVRFPAASVYLPGPYFPVCYPVPVGPNTYWFTIFVPSYSGFVPPGVPGICPAP